MPNRVLELTTLRLRVGCSNDWGSQMLLEPITVLKRGSSVERHRRHIFADALRTWIVVTLIPYYSSRDGLTNNCKYKRECQKICQASVTSTERLHPVSTTPSELNKVFLILFAKIWINIIETIKLCGSYKYKLEFSFTKAAADQSSHFIRYQKYADRLLHVLHRRDSAL